MTDFNSSKTKENLLKAFAGESQARNRYTFAASAAKTEVYSILQDLFLYTANQEIAHAKHFMDNLKEESVNPKTILDLNCHMIDIIKIVYKINTNLKHSLNIK